jgi:DNA modification methylase
MMDIVTDDLGIIKSGLIRGDCLEVMKTLESGSIDLVLTDPPYGTTACKWDSVIPFEPMWAELKRIRKPNSAIVLFGSEPFSSHLRMSNIKEFKYDWIWKKGKETCGGFLQAKNCPIQNFEILSVFSDGKTFHQGRTKRRMSYNPQGLVEINELNNGRNRLHHLRTVKNAKKPKDYIQTHTNYPQSILCFKSELKGRLHPTQKPVPLLEYLIKTYTIEGDTVLDFTMGSGSTGVACKNLNRKFIGIEKDEKYFEIAKQRIG